MEAALQRDTPTACLLLKEHIQSTLQNVEAILRSQSLVEVS
jgi:DNA-binding GntR family transcriptional regulator